MATRNSGAWLGVLLAFASLATPAAAREGWNCNYSGQGTDPARYVTRLERRGHELIEPHWTAPIAYRILVDTRDMLVAVHAYAEPPSFRRDPRGVAVVLIINKYTGQMRRSTAGTGELDDHILTGSCERL
jgi:hypothetical protein